MDVTLSDVGFAPPRLDPGVRRHRHLRRVRQLVSPEPLLLLEYAKILAPDAGRFCRVGANPRQSPSRFLVERKPVYVLWFYALSAWVLQSRTSRQLVSLGSASAEAPGTSCSRHCVDCPTRPNGTLSLLEIESLTAAERRHLRECSTPRRMERHVEQAKELPARTLRLVPTPGSARLARRRGPRGDRRLDRRLGGRLVRTPRRRAAACSSRRWSRASSRRPSSSSGSRTTRARRQALVSPPR